MYGKSFTGGSFGRSVGKSFSASNLRQHFAADGESVLSPGAFTPGSSRYSSGSIRRLTIDRSLKPDLFSRPPLPALPAAKDTSNGATNGMANGAPSGPGSHTDHVPEQPSKLRKRVSFDEDATSGKPKGDLNGVDGALVRTGTGGPEPTTEEQGYHRTSRRNKSASTSSSNTPEMEEARGKELAVVPEDRVSDHVVSEMRLPSDAPAVADTKPGEYWMRPSRAEIGKMPRDKLQHFKGLQIGRFGCGSVTFDGPVDLTSLPIDNLYGTLVEITVRSIAVYPDISTKPPVGKGLNVPSTLQLENSWPRARKQPLSTTSGPLFDKHIARLKRIGNTEFISYDAQTGVWTFRVPHFSRYGLDYDDEDEGENLHQSSLSPPPDSPKDATPPQDSSNASTMEVDNDTPEESSPEDDTFAFKQKTVPGGFGRQSIIDDERDEIVLSTNHDNAASESEHLEALESDGLDQDQDMDMAGSFPQQDASVEQHFNSPTKPILKADQHQLGTPDRPLIDLEGDWAEQLQRTISPRKQNREALREVQGKVLADKLPEPPKQPNSSNKNDFRTSIDVMNSLFGKHEERMALGRRQGAAGPTFEV